MRISCIVMTETQITGLESNPGCPCSGCVTMGKSLNLSDLPVLDQYLKMMTTSTGIPFCPPHCPADPLSLPPHLQTLWVGYKNQNLVQDSSSHTLSTLEQKSWDLGNRKRPFTSPGPMPCTGGETETRERKKLVCLPASHPGPVFWQHLHRPETKGRQGRGAVCVFALTTQRISHPFRTDGGKMNFLLN